MLGVVIFLFGTMLIAMLTRVFLPIGQKPEGTTIQSIHLAFRYRLLYHRTSVYLIGTAVVLGSIGGWLSFTIETVIILATFAIVSMKIRYTFTTEGVALNNVVFRHWEEFKECEQDGRYIRLLAKPGMRNFKILLPANQQEEVKNMAGKLLARRMVVATQATTKKPSRKQALKARRSAR